MFKVSASPLISGTLTSSDALQRCHPPSYYCYSATAPLREGRAPRAEGAQNSPLGSFCSYSLSSSSTVRTRLSTAKEKEYIHLAQLVQTISIPNVIAKVEVQEDSSYLSSIVPRGGEILQPYS